MCPQWVHSSVRSFGTGVALALVCAGTSLAQTGDLAIEWEVANRFRLFAVQADFDAQVTASRAIRSKSVLDLEQELAKARGGGWAAAVHRLCYDEITGRVLGKCRRDGVEEDYLNPKDVRVKLTAKLPSNFGNGMCTWTIGSGTTAKVIANQDCAVTVYERVVTGQATTVAVAAQSESGRSLQASTTVQTRDVLIVGLGDSTASGEGNPIAPVALNDNGFCFRRVAGTDRQRFFLPGRAKANVVADCPLPGDVPDQRDAWEAANAQWMFAPCHLSLYSYQARAALALAIENPSLSVTYYPMGCTGATIREGLLGSQKARERPKHNGMPFPATVSGQIEQLASYLRTGQSNARPADLIFLTIGGNDLDFSGLVADILLVEGRERRILERQKLISTPADARRKFGAFAENFKALRRSLARFTGGKLDRVIFVNYGNLAMHEGNRVCPASRRGFDAHPAFAINGEKLEATTRFVEDEFLPLLKNQATCGSGAACQDPERDRMTYVDEHRPAFLRHGYCAADAQDPAFDRDCFRDGDSFNNAAQGGLNKPLKCNISATRFQPYTKRARWIRTVNDSFFTAMTYPAMGGLADPADIHDALWGVASVVYGGAMHPTGEGHAAMADAALPAARRLLGFPAVARDENPN